MFLQILKHCIYLSYVACIFHSFTVEKYLQLVYYFLGRWAMKVVKYLMGSRISKKRWKKFTANIQQDTIVGYYRNPKSTSEWIMVSRVFLFSYSVTVLPGDMHCPGFC